MTAPTTTGAKLETRTIYTINASRESKGSIHDDEKAREMGYAGGFVGGVTVLGYMMRLMHENFGQSWLATGHFNGRLRQPTYADVDVTVEGTVANKKVAAGQPIALSFTFVGTDGQALGTEEVSITAPAIGASAPFSLKFATDAAVAGWRYTVAR